MISAPERGSYARTMGMVATTVIVLLGMRIAAPILNPVLFSLVLAIIFNPIYAWLRRQVPMPLAIAVTLIGLIILFGTLSWVVSVSVTRLITQLGSYASELQSRLAGMERLIERASAVHIDFSWLYSSSSLVSAAGLLLSGLLNFVGNVFLILMLILFFLVEGPAMLERLRAGSGADDQIDRLVGFGANVSRQFGLRAIINGVVAMVFSLFLLLLGVDFPLLWGILAFFLGYIPYLGIILAGVPATLLALAEFGFGSALLVVVGLTVINLGAENVLSPMLMGRGLSLSPTAVFVAFAFWTWLLGAAGAFLAMPMLFLTVILFGAFPETRWLAELIMVRVPGAAREAVPEPVPNRA